MSADGPATSPDDPRVEEAVKTWTIAPRLKVKKVMLAVRFIPSDAASKHTTISHKGTSTGGTAPSGTTTSGRGDGLSRREAAEL